jgi:dihydrofolate reductase
MGKLIQWNNLTLDGYFEGAKSWDVEWFQQYFSDELREFSLKQLDAAEALLFGRLTYEGMAAYWKTATGDVAQFMNRLPKYVFSSTLKIADWEGTTIIPGDPNAAVRRLKERAVRDLFVFGSGRLSATLLEGGLFDEVRLGLTPIVIGAGTTLFGRGMPRTKMGLLEARRLNNGCVILRYEPLRA